MFVNPVELQGLFIKSGLLFIYVTIIGQTNNTQI